MRVSRNGKNAFSLKEVTKITGIKPAMVNFLIRNDYLRPSYREDHDFRRPLAAYNVLTATVSA
jgi:hypothetical protein